MIFRPLFIRYNWNKTWLDYTGQTYEEALGRAWDGIIHPDDVQGVLDIYLPAFEKRESYYIPAIRVKRYAETTWTQDKMHTQLHFGATHFGISQVEGVFQTFTSTMKSEKEDFSDA